MKLAQPEWRAVGPYLVFWATAVLGGALLTLVMMRECAGRSSAAFVALTAALALVGGTVACLRGVRTRAVVSSVGVIVLVAYLAAALWCNRWTPDDEKAFREWQKEHAAPAGFREVTPAQGPATPGGRP
jgi:hypothetical protein